MPILDQFGRPIATKTLTRELATSSVVGVRRPSFSVVSNGLTPEALASVLLSAADGDIEQFLTLAEEMEERDLHYRGVLGDRKQAIAGAPIRAEAQTEDAHENEIAEVFQTEVIDRPNFRPMVFDLLDALGKSFSVVEPVWDTSATPWRFAKFAYRDPRWFTFAQGDLSTLLMKTDESPEGVEPPGGAFVVHIPKLKSGIPIRGGLGWACAISYMCKMFTLKDWLAFMDVYGQPIRIGRYDSELITEPERATFRTALANIGHDAAAMVPKGFDLEIIDAKRGDGKNIFPELADYLDKQVSKAVLGQTMTSDNGSSLAQAKVHNEVRQDIKEADAVSVAATIQAGIVAPWVAFNYGPDAPVPLLVIDVSPPEDLKAFTETVIPWVQEGVTVDAGHIREKFGMPEPESDDVIGGKPEPSEEGGPVPPEEDETALNAEITGQDPDLLERETEIMLQAAAGEWSRVMEPHARAIEELASACNSFEEFRKGLEDLAKKMDSDPLVALLAEKMLAMRGVGDAT